MNSYLKYILVGLFTVVNYTIIFGQTVLCEADAPISTNTFYLRFAESALELDDIPYFGDDITLHTLYKNKEKGLTCGGRFRFDKGERVTMALTGKDFFVTSGFGEGEGVFLVLQKDDGCILDSLSISINGDSEEKDSLIFRANSIIDITSLKAKTGDCLLTSSSQIPILTSVKVYPNPTTENLHVTLKSEENMELQYNLTNHLGQVIKSEQLKGNFIQKTISLAHLPPSIYYIVFHQNGFVTTKKIILVE